MLTGLIYKGSVTKTFENESPHTHTHSNLTSTSLPAPEFQRALKLRWLSSGQCQPEKRQEKKKITNLEGYLGQLSFTALLLPLQLA